ncbi:hypothetical protein, partial [Streptomyces levis]|uniref:hypothetical protein n=1 Tax=Streptomyces levis TaxID=285566 RepID=UPI0031E08607
RLYQIFSRPDFLGAFQVSAFAVSFPALPTLSEVSESDFPPRPDMSSVPELARVPRREEL